MEQPEQGTYWKSKLSEDIYVVTKILGKIYLVNFKGSFYSSNEFDCFDGNKENFIQVEMEFKAIPPQRVEKTITFRRLKSEEMVPDGAFYSYNDGIKILPIYVKHDKTCGHYEKVAKGCSFWVIDKGLV